MNKELVFELVSRKLGSFDWKGKIYEIFGASKKMLIKLKKVEFYQDG